MKKINYLIIILLIFVLSFNVYAQKGVVRENIVPIRNDDGEIIKFRDTIRISNKKNKEFELNSEVFNVINHYKNIKDIKELELEFKVSGYSIVKRKIKINKLDYKNDSYYPYRSYNKALISLIDSGDISDDNINKELKKIGYKGIDELDKYYKDYYMVNKLKFKDIYDGEVSNYKETNHKLVKLAYDYFYKNILVINRFSDDKVIVKINKNSNINVYNNYLFNVNVKIMLRKKDYS